MLYFTIQNRLQAGTSQVSEAAGARWRFCGRISSDYRRIVFLLAEAFREFPLKSWASRFRGRRSIWWGWRVTLLAPRIGNDVLYVTQIRDDIHFAWLAQYLLRLPGDFSWQAHHFVTFSEIATTRNVVFYNTKSSPSWDESGLRSGGCEMTILWSDIVGLSSNRLSIGGSIQGVSAEILSFKISRQAQYLVRLAGDFTCSTHWKWRFICDADQGWHSFCVAGAVFGEVAGWLFVTGAALRDIFGDSNDAKCCILQYKIVSKLGRVRSPKRRVRDDDFVVGYRRIIVESSFYWRKHFREFPRKSWPSRFRGRRSIWWGWRVTWLL